MMSPFELLRRRWPRRSRTRELAAVRAAAAASTPAPAPHPGPRVLLQFRDGSRQSVDPGSTEGRALVALADQMHAGL